MKKNLVLDSLKIGAATCPLSHNKTKILPVHFRWEMRGSGGGNFQWSQGSSVKRGDLHLFDHLSSNSFVHPSALSGLLSVLLGLKSALFDLWSALWNLKLVCWVLKSASSSLSIGLLENIVSLRPFQTSIFPLSPSKPYQTDKLLPDKLLNYQLPLQVTRGPSLVTSFLMDQLRGKGQTLATHNQGNLVVLQIFFIQIN